MYTEFVNPTRAALSFSRNQIIVYLVWSSMVVCTYYFSKWELISIPFLPVSLIGTALAYSGTCDREKWCFNVAR